MVRPADYRRAVGYLQAEHQMSERRSCRVLGFCRASAQYQPRREVPVELVAKLRELAARRPRWGYRRLHILLRREGLVVNHKRVYRLYRQEGLAVRQKRRKRLASAIRTVLPPPTAPNERWSMDYVSDALAGGTRFRAFVVVDDFTRECLAIEVDSSIPGLRAARVLERIGETRPLPKTLVCDNGPEFTGRDFDSWAFRCGVHVHFIRPGKPVENAYAESFNGKFRDECLNESWFVTLADARSRIEDWRLDYNQARPHSGLDNLTPLEFALRHNSVAADAA
jgi:putative transposase